MYFFYFDESGSRDPSVGTEEMPKDHLYVLLTMGMYEGQWHRFDGELSRLKLELAHYAHKASKRTFQLADCEIKSNWIRNPSGRSKASPFLSALDDDDRERIVRTYYRQIAARKTVIMATVIDKRHLHSHVTPEILHKKAYEFLLERIQHYIQDYHRKHRAIIVMDDTHKQLNRAVAMKHAHFQRTGNQNMLFPSVVEYPFFARSELSNGVQLADLLAYNVYRAFRDEDLDYPYFKMLLPNFYRRRGSSFLNGLKVWPDTSPLVGLAQTAGLVSSAQGD